MGRGEQYKQKVIDILNSNFGEDYSIEWLDDTHFSLTYREPVYNDAHEIVGKVTTSIQNATLEISENNPESAYILAGAARNMSFDRSEKT